MAKPVEHSGIGGAADVAGAGLTRGLVGAVAGTAIVVAAFALAGAVVLGGGLGLIGIGAGTTGALGTLGAVIAGVGSLFTVAPIAGAAIGGGAGAIGGIAKRSEQIQQENLAAKNVGHGHDMQVAQQIAEARAQAAEQTAPAAYNQGAQDMLQMVQQQAMQQQAMAEAEQPTKSFVKDELERRGADESVDLANASHADKVSASKEHAGGHALNA